MGFGLISYFHVDQLLLSNHTHVCNSRSVWKNYVVGQINNKIKFIAH
eukprot:UN23890